MKTVFIHSSSFFIPVSLLSLLLLIPSSKKERKKKEKREEIEIGKKRNKKIERDQVTKYL